MNNGVGMTLEYIMESLTLSTCSPRCWCHYATVTNWPIRHQLDFYSLLPLLSFDPVWHEGLLQSDALPEPASNSIFHFLPQRIPILILHIQPEIQRTFQFISMVMQLFLSQETWHEEYYFYVYKNTDIACCLAVMLWLWICWKKIARAC